MATVAVLNTLVTANTNPFNKAMGSVSGTLNSVSLSMKSMLKVIGGVGAAVAAFAGIRGAVSGVGDAMERIDQLAKDSERMGLAVDELQSLQHAAGLAGVSIESLSPAFARMARTIVDAQAGSETATAALKTLGLSADQLIGMSPDAAFKQIADAIAAVENPMLRAAAAQGLFGKGAAELLPILNAGRAGIEAANTELASFGALITGVDAAQVEAANDSFSRVQKIIAAVNDQIAVKLAPFLEDLALRAQRFAVEMGGAGSIATTAFEAVAVGIAQSMRVVDAFSAAWHTARAVVAGVLGGIVRGIHEMAVAIIDALNLIPGVSITLNDELKTLSDAFIETATDAAESAAAAFGNAFSGDRVQEVREYFREIEERQRAAAELVDANRAKMRTVEQIAAAAEKSVSDVSKAVDVSVSRIEDAPWWGQEQKSTAFEDRAFGVTSRDSFAGARAEQGFGTYLNDKGENKQIANNTKQTVAELKKLANAMKQSPWLPAPL